MVESETVEQDVSISEERSDPGGVAADRASRVNDLRLEGYPKSLEQLYAVMTGALIVQVALHAFTFLCEAGASTALGATLEGSRTLLGHLYFASFFVLALAIPLGCLAWFRWLDWSIKNRLVASEGRFGRTPAGVVWSYFIPVLNLFKPLLDLQRLWRAESRFGGEAPLVLAAWWVLTLAHLGMMAFALLGSSTALTAASSALGVLSNVLALMVLSVFWRVQTTADRRFVREEMASGDVAMNEGALA